MSPAPASTLPPGPRSSLFSIVDYFRDPIGCLLPYRAKYGDVFTFPGDPPVVMVGDPAAIKAVYSAEPEALAPLNVSLGKLLGPRSVLFLGGAEHKRARKLLAPPFHAARMRAYADSVRSILRARTDALRAGDHVEILRLAQDVSLDVILQAVFGVRDPAEMEALREMLLDITNKMSPLLAVFPQLWHDFGGVGPYASFMRKKRRFHAKLDELIAARRASGPKEDILSLLLDVRDEDGAPLPLDDLRDQLVLLVGAGHETTANAIAWAFYALHRPENAAVLERLRAEVEPAGDDPEALARLPYLEAVCNETLRRYPIAPAPNPRKLLRPLEVAGYTLPAGTGVGVAIGMVHFREDLYPEPMKFRPERFLERSFSPFEFVPFGGGLRRCLGAPLAHYEMKLTVGTLIGRLQLRLASLKEDRGKVRLANAGPKGWVEMVVSSRTQ